MCLTILFYTALLLQVEESDPIRSGPRIQEFDRSLANNKNHLNVTFALYHLCLSNVFDLCPGLSLALHVILEGTCTKLTSDLELSSYLGLISFAYCR